MPGALAGQVSAHPGVIPQLADLRPGELLHSCLDILTRLLAPFVPFVSEEVWRWWHDTSVHLAPWPSLEELGSAPVASGVYAAVGDVLEAVRREKSTQKVSQRKEVAELVIAGPGELLEVIMAGQRDLVDACGVRSVVYE